MNGLEYLLKPLRWAEGFQYNARSLWYITHRCHKREFLLKFGKDKKRWVDWLFEAKKRFGFSILDYAVTSNHIHSLVFDSKGLRKNNFTFSLAPLTSSFDDARSRDSRSASVRLWSCSVASAKYNAKRTAENVKLFSISPKRRGADKLEALYVLNSTWGIERNRWDLDIG